MPVLPTDEEIEACKKKHGIVDVVPQWQKDLRGGQGIPKENDIEAWRRRSSEEDEEPMILGTGVLVRKEH